MPLTGSELVFALSELVLDGTAVADPSKSPAVWFFAHREEGSPVISISDLG